MTKTAVNDLRALLALRRNYVLAGTRRRGPLRDLRAGARRLAYRRAPAGDPGATLTAATGDAFHPARTQGSRSVDAKSVIDAAGPEKISVATLTRARTLLRIRSQKQRSGWMWVRPQQ
jgi:hypothetical protein